MVLGLYPKDSRSEYYSDTATSTFIAAQFTIAFSYGTNLGTYKDKWLKKMWYIHTMEYYSAINKNEIIFLLVNGWNRRLSC